jgi:DNA-binding response OmpR family regulator
MSESPQHIEASLLVRDLLQGIGSWKLQYKMLGDRLAGLQIFQSNLDPQHPDYFLSREVLEALLPFISLYKDKSPSTNDFTSTLKTCLELEARAKQQPGGDDAGRVYGALHSLVNILSLLRNTSLSMATLSEASKSITISGHIAQNLWGQLQALATPDGRITNELISQMETVCRGLEPYLPPPISPLIGNYASKETRVNKIYILLVEDDSAWLADVERVLGQLAAAYRSSTCEVEIGIARTYEDTQKLLRRLTTGEDAEWAVIIILDIGLPLDATELERIEKYTSTVGRKWGRKLLHFAREYKQRYDVIVFTSITNYPEDHRAALESGVSPSDFILKGPGAMRELEQSIHRILSPQRAPRLEILNEAGNRLRLNGIEVELDQGPFRTLCVLARNRRRGLSIDEIADLLDQNYPGEYRRSSHPDDAWEVAQERAAAEGIIPSSQEFASRANEILREINAPLNALEAWRDAQRSQSRDNEGKGRNRKILLAFYENCSEYEDRYPWRWFCEYVELPATHPAGWGEKLISKAYLVASKELTAARLRPGSFEPESVHDHVYHIRTRLYSTCHIDPARYVLVTEESEDGFRYRLVADVVFLADGSANRQTEFLSEDEQCRVLVVENDQAWLEQIGLTLKSGWYSVRQATTVVDAVRLAETFSPHILCLDLHLPYDDDELRRWAGGEISAERSGGVKVLHAVQRSNPSIKAVILSSFASDDEMRVLATRAGVDIHDVISKVQLAGSWEGEFLRAIWKNEQELRRGVLLPATADLPFISIKLEEHGPRSRGARISSSGGDKWVPMREKEFTLLGIFRDVGYRPVSRDEMMERMYGDDWPDKQEAFDNVLKRLRQAIVQNGLGVASEHTRKLGTTIITHSSGTYLLRCKIL